MTNGRELNAQAGLGPMFGQVLFEIRTCAGISLGELARRSRLSKGRLSQLENSRVGAPPPKAVDKLAHALRADERTRRRLVDAALSERQVARIVFDRGDSPHIRVLAARLRACAGQLSQDDAQRLLAAWEEVSP